MIITGGGGDYVSGPYDVTLFAGNTTASFDIGIINDTILENNEKFAVAINPSSLPSSVHITDPSNVTITIMDDEGKLIITMCL